MTNLSLNTLSYNCVNNQNTNCETRKKVLQNNIFYSTQTSQINSQIGNPYQKLSQTDNSYVINTSFPDKKTEEMYYYVRNSCGLEAKKSLQSLRNKNILLNSNSNDKSTVLENLYKIASSKRAKGLDPKMILNETIITLDNPYNIKQKFGNIPRPIEKNILNKKSYLKVKTQSEKPVNNNYNVYSINPKSSCCVAASIEFNMASKYPSEFARMVNELSSPKLCVIKKIKLSSLSDEKMDAINTLSNFKVKFKLDSELEHAFVLLKPDKNAIIRAYIQCIDKDPDERSVIDVLLQSTFMNTGTQSTYNSLTDKNDSDFSYEKVGLTSTEKNFVEQITEDKSKINITYQILDDNTRLVGRSCELEEIQDHILKSLETGSNVIIGITTLNRKQQVINGHEVTIVGSYIDKKTGELYFVINDTDDNISKPIYKKASEILPQIHHAGIVKSAVIDQIEVIPNGDIALDFYHNYIETGLI